MTALAWLALAAVVLAGAGLAYLIGSDLIDRARADDQLPTDDFDRHADDALAVGNDTYPCGCGRMCPTHEGALEDVQERLDRYREAVAERRAARGVSEVERAAMVRDVSRGWSLLDELQVRRLLDGAS